MKKTIISLFSAFVLLVVIASTISSAYPYSYSDNYYSTSFPSSKSYFSSGSSTYIKETPEYRKYPVEKSNSNSNSNQLSTNFDSSSYNYDYRGPMFERTVVYNENINVDKSSKAGFFSSRSNDLYSHQITNTIKEKYVGASESVYQNSQNRQTSSKASSSSSNKDYNGGFSWGKARVYDQEEYSSSSSRYGNDDYYYRPYYDNQKGYYIWDY